MSLRSPVFLACLVVLVSACSSTKSNGSGPLDDGGAGGLGTSEAPYALAYTTPASQETHWCEYRKMPKSDSGDVLVSGVRWSWKSAHHWGLYRLVPSAPVADLPLGQPFDCFAPAAMQYAQYSSSFLQGEPSGTIDFPAGTAFPFKSEEVVLFQTHSINTTSAPAAISLDVTFRVADASVVKDRLGLIQFYDPYIVVPAHTDAVAQMRCKVPQDITLVRSTTHQHTRGTKAETFLDGADGSPAPSPFVSTTNWDSPQIVTEPVKVTAGQYIRTVCHYKGDDHPMVVQGQNKADNEMCMTIAYYYPVVSPDVQPLFENCVQNPALTPEGRKDGFGDSFGTGTDACAAALTCVQDVVAKDPTEAPTLRNAQLQVGGDFQKCVVNSCPSASAPLVDMLTCVGTSCSTECADPTKCQACVLDKCSVQLGACYRHACAP
jgi:Copper type II ascorbate-dependent monooxygenase, C-terminal domain